MAEVLCKHFSGYKPCSLNKNCNQNCPSRSIPETRILLIHLDAMGAVLRSTALLPAIKRKYSNSHITWITRSRTQELLLNNPLIDRIVKLDTDGLLEMAALEFDVALVVDKSLVAAGILKNTKVKEVFGFRTEKGTGSIVPATPHAHELWEIGLSDQKKFFENIKTENQLSCEALALDYQRDPYILRLYEDEMREAFRRREDWRLHSKFIVGINTGCSGAIPYKKLSIHKHRELIQKLRQIRDIRIVLLGGIEDTERNEQIAYGTPVVVSPTQNGLRDGLISTAACDIVVTGDSLGMHMAIALKKWTVAWFGPTCANEIDLYDRGVKIQSAATCGPCWKRSCHKDTMCYDLVSTDEIAAAVEKGLTWQTSSSRLPLSETPSSASL